MKFTAALAVVFISANLVASEPTLLATKLAKKFLLKKLITGKALPVPVPLPKLPLPLPLPIPKFALPYPLSVFLTGPAVPAPVDPVPPVVYYALPTEDYDNAWSSIPDKELNFPGLEDNSGAASHASAAVAEGAAQSTELSAGNAGVVDLRGPVYHAETPSAVHIAPLPEGYTDNVFAQNLPNP